MNDRDHFAAAALTGLIANGDYSVESTPSLAWRMADAMLRERASTNSAEISSTLTNHDAAPAAKAQVDAAGISRQGTGDTFTLTDAEREAIEEAADTSDVAAEFYSGKDRTRADAAAKHAATLRGLLERLGGGDE